MTYTWTRLIDRNLTKSALVVSHVICLVKTIATAMVMSPKMKNVRWLFEVAKGFDVVSKRCTF